MKNKLITLLIIFFILFPNSSLGFRLDLFEYNDERLTLVDRLSPSRCQDYKESDIPTIFIPGTLASWYSVEGFEDTDTYLRKTSR